MQHLNFHLLLNIMKEELDVWIGRIHLLNLALQNTETRTR